MEGLKKLTSTTIYLFFSIGILATSKVVFEEINSGNACPKVKSIPICYVVLSCFILGLFSHVFKLKNYIYFVSIGIAFIIALIATILHLQGKFCCPKTIIKGTPKCYYAIGLFSSLLLLKISHSKAIKKDLM